MLYLFICVIQGYELVNILLLAYCELKIWNTHHRQLEWGRMWKKQFSEDYIPYSLTKYVHMCMNLKQFLIVV